MSAILAHVKGNFPRLGGLVFGMDFAKRLKHLRQLRGLSQVKLAKLAEIDQTTISLLERGNTHNATGRVISALAQVLGVSTDYLLAGQETPDKTMLRPEIVELAYKLQSLPPDKIELIAATVAAFAGPLVPSQAAPNKPQKQH